MTKIVDEQLLSMFRRKARCEYCCKRVRTGLDPHHLWARGMGGGRRLDIKINLLALCRTCHDKAHRGLFSRAELLQIVAEREERTPQYITDEINRLLMPESRR